MRLVDFFIFIFYFFGCLEERIREQREISEFVGESGRRNATMAIRLCVSAVQNDFPAIQIKKPTKRKEVSY